MARLRDRHQSCNPNFFPSGEKCPETRLQLRARLRGLYPRPGTLGENSQLVNIKVKRLGKTLKINDKFVDKKTQSRLGKGKFPPIIFLTRLGDS